MIYYFLKSIMHSWPDGTRMMKFMLHFYVRCIMLVSFEMNFYYRM